LALLKHSNRNSDLEFARPGVVTSLEFRHRTGEAGGAIDLDGRTAAVGSESVDDIVKHKFQTDSEMSFQSVFSFAFGTFIPLLQKLAEELGEQQVLSTLRVLACQSGFRAGQADGRRQPSNDFTAFHRQLREPNYFWRHVLTFDIVEDTPRTFGLRVTECLWAKTFREIGAEELGYALICHPDYDICRGFNPRITMTRSKTLMQGHDHCDHCWTWSD